jgi:uncharacterized protein YbbC (DUF1343 family)
MVVKLKILVAILLIFQTPFFSCENHSKKSDSIVRSDNQTNNGGPLTGVSTPAPSGPVLTGAENMQEYLHLLHGKNVALVVNHTSLVGNQHLVDTLLARGVKVSTIFAPEHGFRGTADAGEHFKDMKDPKTAIPIVSLYGKKKKPGTSDLEKTDVLVFDIQDVGTRFYTFLSTLCYVMEACAENKLPLIILDRPNPNGHFVDGPVLRKTHQSFVGLHEVPVVHGMTLGEYANMASKEGWLDGGAQCDLTVIACKNYNHRTFYQLPLNPSPNLPNMRSIYLYPSLCFFEGTVVSVGRGTDKQFQVLGVPGFPNGNYSFTPVPKPGAKNPPHEGVECRGLDLSQTSIEELQKKQEIDLSYLLSFYTGYPHKEKFFLPTLFFDKLAGSAELRNQLIAGKSEEVIRASWKADLEKFKNIRKKYLLYEDF